MGLIGPRQILPNPPPSEGSSFRYNTRRGLFNFCVRKGFLMHRNQKRLQFSYNLQKNGLLGKEGKKCNLLILLVPRAGVEPARWGTTEGF